MNVLTDGQLRQLHAASLRLLGEVGVHIPHARMLARFKEAGAHVDRDTQIVTIPETIVAHALETCGKTFTIYGRDRSLTAAFGQGTRNYNSTAGQALWVDDDFTTRRYPSLEDVATAARLGDALPWINIVGAMADPHEIPPAHRCVVVAAELLKHTTKPVTFWFHDGASARFLVELFTIVAGSEAEAARYPLAYPLLEPISPLSFPHDALDLLEEVCRLPLPVQIGPMAQVGATAPGTLAGTLAQENAEILAGICAVQLVREGTPVCYGGLPHAFDMRSTRIIFGGPEQALMAVAMTQMGKFYGLPVYINAGLTDSKLPDAQAGIETGITLSQGAMAGADIFCHLGICGADLGASTLMLMLQHEVIGYTERMLRGIDFSEETLGIDVIRKVGPRGNFLAEEHTCLHFRDEVWVPELLDRSSWENWLKSPDRDMMARCRSARDQILSTHTPVPLDDDTTREVDALLADARLHLD